MLSLEEFIPFYPFFNSHAKYNSNIYSGLTPTESLVLKKEFLENKLNPTIEDELKTSKFFKHQNTISNFINNNTNYDGILVFHMMGTGKTSTVINSIESNKKNKSVWDLQKSQRALIIVKNSSLERNFISELVKMLPQIYLPPNFDDLTEMEKIRRINKRVAQYYEIHQMEAFAKKLVKMTDREIELKYSKRTIVIDEIHNIRDSGNKTFDMYKIYHNFLHTVSNCKKILMSGTPMKDKVYEIASVMNLILPMNQQLPTKDSFMKEYFINDVLNVNKIKELQKVFYGRVSYLKVNYGNKINIKYEGETDIKVSNDKVIHHFKVFRSEMNEFQDKSYKRAYKLDFSSNKKVQNVDLDDIEHESKQLEILSKDPSKDTAIKGIYLNARQASDFVYPDGSFGMEGFKKFISIKTKKNIMDISDDKSKYSLTKDFMNVFREGKTIQDRLNILRKHSCKDYLIIKSILNNPKDKVFVAGEFVTGSGMILFSKVLELFGFTKAKGNETTIGKRYILITGEATSSQITKLISKYNQPKNVHGDYIQVIIGSKIISEGVSFSDTVQCHIREPHWNFSDLEQFIYRIIRATSYENLLKEQEYDDKINVRIFLHASLSSYADSIDLLMYYISEYKDLLIKQIEHIIKITAFDCYLNYDRNLKSSELDGNRDCEYKNCFYSCYDVDSEKIEKYGSINDTYSLFYSEKQIEDTIQNVSELFSSRFSMTLNDLKNNLPNVSEYILLSSLQKLILFNIKIRNKYGIDCYLKENKNTYYLIYDNNTNPKFEDLFYTIYPSLQLNNETGLAKELILKNIEKCCSGKSSYSDIQKYLSQELENMFIESSIIANEQKLDTNRQLYTEIISKYQSYIQRFGNNVVCTFLKPRCLCLKTFQWSDCSPELIQKVEDKLNVNVRDNRYGYYGIIDKKGNFKIMDIEQSKIVVQDKRKKIKGLRCASWQKDLLVKMSVKIGIILNDTLIHAYKKLAINEFVENGLLSSLNLSTIESLQKININILASAMYLLKENKVKSCNILKEWFIDHGIVVYE